MKNLKAKIYKNNSSKADQNSFNETLEILKHSLELWKEFFKSLDDKRNLARMERVTRGQIHRILELQAGGTVE